MLREFLEKVFERLRKEKRKVQEVDIAGVREKGFENML